VLQPLSLRLQKKGKVPQSWTHIEAANLIEAEERWVRTIQQSCFLEEIKVLKSGHQIKSNQLIALFLDKENLIHCGGRVDSADIPEEPLLLST